MGGRPASQHRLYDTLTRPPPPPPSPPPPAAAAEAEQELSGETALVYPLTSQETLAYLQRQRTELIASRSSAGLSRSRSSPQHALVSGLTPGQHAATTSAPLPLPPGGRPPPLSLPCSPPSSPATVFNSPAIVFNSPAIGTRGPPPGSPSTGARGAQQQWQHGLPSPATAPTKRPTRPRVLPLSPGEAPYAPFSPVLFPHFPRPPQTAPAATPHPHRGARAATAAAEAEEEAAAAAAAVAAAATLPLPPSHVLPPGLGLLSEGVEDADTTPGEMEFDPAARDTPPPSPREAALLAEQRRLARLKAEEEARRAAAEALLQEQFRKQQEYMRRKAEARNRRETSLTVIKTSDPYPYP